MRTAKTKQITLAATLLAAVVLAAASTPASEAGTSGRNRPNVIVIVTDDQTVSELTADSMPQTVKHLADAGTSFTQSIVSSPLCCPSRASSRPAARIRPQCAT